MYSPYDVRVSQAERGRFRRVGEGRAARVANEEW